MEVKTTKNKTNALADLKRYTDTLFVLPTGHYAKITDGNEKTVIVFTHEKEMLGTKVRISMCHESENANSTTFAYPLLKEMNPVDLGTFADYVDDPVNAPYYHAVLKTDPSIQGITIVRCIEHMKEAGMEPEVIYAGEALAAVHAQEEALEAATQERFSPDRFIEHAR